jgi:two-component system chemotaxis sensor kinase CheA
MVPNNLDPVLHEYFAECEELNERVSQSLQALEKGQSSPELIDSIYRDIHTLKGSSQLFGFKAIGDLGHAMESSLDPIRRLSLTPSAKLLELLFQCLDLTTAMVRAIKDSSEEDFTPQVNQLIPALIEQSLQTTESSHFPVTNDHPSHLRDDFTLEGKIAKEESSSITTAIAPIASEPQTPVLQSSPIYTPSPSIDSNDSSSSIRVPVTLLDKLMTITGEMVLVRNQVLQYANKSDDLEFLNLSQRLDVVTSEIQGEVMKTRMQPIGNVLTKFQRVIRDLAKELNKKIELNLSGTETELDKTLLEAIKDPLMHIVRNSCDHGIESITERKTAGKSDTGQISIRSFHEGGQVIVEISDNGKGLDRNKLTQKAIEKGILTQEKATSLTESEAFALIFAPGFSLANQVTNVSGRGVGMDVVKNNIEGIGGTVEIQSKTGQGTTTRLKIPLTLAIVPAMIVRNRDERFAIPQVKLVELVRVERGSGNRQIEYLQGRPIFRLRENLLPLVTLNEVLASGSSDQQITQDICNIVILNAEGRLFGLIVDEVQDTAEVVVKPMNSFLKSLPLYSGATVLGDGSVALILDVAGIAKQQRLLGENSNQILRQEEDRTVRSISESQEFLLFRLNAEAKHAIPMNLVHRLEEFPKKSIERSGAQRVVRYRNAILPIVSLNEYLGLAPAQSQTESDNISIIVTQKSGRLFGIEVNDILDVLNTVEPMDSEFSDHPGILGNVVTEEEVIVIVDVLHVLDDTMKRLNVNSPSVVVPKAKQTPKLKILLAEDTAFFRKHVCAVLQREGHLISTAENGADAMDILNKSARGEFDLVLSDIEMPKMNGLQFAEAVRQHDVWKDVPMIALTTKFSQIHIEEGKRAGFTAYLEKLNPEVLLAEIAANFENNISRRNAS